MTAKCGKEGKLEVKAAACRPNISGRAIAYACPYAREAKRFFLLKPGAVRPFLPLAARPSALGAAGKPYTEGVIPMTVIGTNISSLRAANASKSANSALSSAMERLSTGKRINSAKDDAAGLAIAQSMSSQIRGMNQAIRNANDGAAMAQTAEGALGEVSNMLQRIRELAVQASSGTYSEDDRDNMQLEVTALTAQIDDVLQKTEFNGVKLFSSDDKTVDIQTGSNSDNKVDMKFTALNLSDITGTAAYNQAAGASGASGPSGASGGSGPAGPSGGAGATGGLSIAGTTGGTARDALDKLDTALQSVATTRANLGASQSRLSSVVNNLSTSVTSLTSARSQIEDADFATETTNLAKAQILSQASTAMLAQANQSQQSVLRLLQ
jgi:flagellin